MEEIPLEVALDMLYVQHTNKMFILEEGDPLARPFSIWHKHILYGYTVTHFPYKITIMRSYSTFMVCTLELVEDTNGNN